jgi:chromosome segregation ATPase
MAKAAVPKKAVTIHRELENLRDEIQARDAESASNARKAERLRNYFAELQRLDGDRRQTLDRYNTALKNLQTEFKEAKKYYDTNNSMIPTGLKRKKADIDHDISEFDMELKKKEADLSALKRQSETAKREYESARKNHDDYQQKYNDLLNQQQIVEAGLKEVATLKEQIQKEENVTKKYFLNAEMGKLLQRIKIKPSSNVSNELDKALRALKSAKEVLDEKEDKFNEANASAKSSESQLEALKKNRRAEILDKL